MDGATIVNQLITSVTEIVSTELTSAGQPPRPGKKTTTSRNACKPRPVQLEQSSAEQIDDDGLADVLKANLLAQFQKPWARLNADQRLDRLNSYVENQEDDSSVSKLEFLTGLLSKKALTAKDVEYDVESASIVNIPRLTKTDSGEYKLARPPTTRKTKAAPELTPADTPEGTPENTPESSQEGASQDAAHEVPAKTTVKKSKTSKPSNLNRILSTMKK